MDEDDDDLDFDFDDLSYEEREEMKRQQKEDEEALSNSPLFKKAKEIYKTVDALLASFSEDERETYEHILSESSMILAAKIAGAFRSGSWLICMQNASIIRYHAEYLHTSTSGLKLFTKAQKEYVKLFRTEIEEFRDLFKDWVQTFEELEREEYLDEWGLFIRR